MTNDWIEHNGGPRPVANGTWVRRFYRNYPGEPFRSGPQLTGPHDNWKDVREYEVLNQHLIDAKQAEIDALQHEVMWLHNALEQTEEAVVYGYTLLDDMDDEIDAARLEGIRLGLEAANKAVEALVGAGDLHIEEESALEEASIAIRALNPETIAREAALEQLTREAQEQGVKYDKEADPHD